MSNQILAVPGKAAHREIRSKRRDFYERYDLLLANWYLLTTRIQHDIESIRQDLHDDLARWQPHQPEPDWNAYANRMNAIAASVTPGRSAVAGTN